MARKQKVEEKVEHTHRWTKDWKETELHCYCGAIQISKLEKDRRIKEWEDYFEKVRDCDTYGDFQLMRVAYKEKNHPLIKEIMERIEQRNHYEEDEETTDIVMASNSPIPKPHFPDPTTWAKYVTP